MSDRIDPHAAKDVAFRAAMRARTRMPHRSTIMLSSQSLSQLKSWYCPICSASGDWIGAYSFDTEAPVCYGPLEHDGE